MNSVVRTLVVVCVQVGLSFVVTASLMPVILVTTPAAQVDARFGLGLMAALLIGTFAVIALAWPKRLK